MYLKYHTDAVVLGVSDSGEADRTYRLLTRDAGLVFATGKSVRSLKSKLRYALQPLSLSEVSLVRGNGVWRLASAVPKSNAFFSLTYAGKYERVLTLARVLTIVERLVRGEEKNTGLYDIVEQGYEHLSKNTLSPDEILTLECLLLLRVLHNLGYLKHEARVTEHVVRNDMTPEALTAVAAYRKECIVEINRALKESQL